MIECQIHHLQIFLSLSLLPLIIFLTIPSTTTILPPRPRSLLSYLLHLQDIHLNLFIFLTVYP